MRGIAFKRNANLGAHGKTFAAGAAALLPDDERVAVREPHMVVGVRSEIDDVFPR